VKISVVICTRNRARSLARTLASLTACAPPVRADLAVMVVDNGSGDGTRAVIDGFRDRLPLTALAAPTPGISHARNAAVASMQTDWFLWTDDDVTVGAGWLRRYEAAFDTQPGTAVFGGPIRLRFDDLPPRWLAASLPLLLPAYAALDLGPCEMPLGRTPRELPFGANFAVRAAEQRAHRYDADLGRRPGRLSSGEESDVVRRILAAGGRAHWLPDADVEHWIDAERQTVDYLRAYYAELGYRSARRASARGQRLSARERWRALRRIAWCESRYHAGRLLGRPGFWVTALKESARLRGVLAAQRPDDGAFGVSW
jgi:glycosyltransferase involved in cell wall biosynthesis